MKLFVPFLLILGVINCEEFDYDGYKVYRVHPKTEEQNQFLLKLGEQIPILDFWNEPNKAGNPVDVMVPPMHQGPLSTMLKGYGLKVTTMIDDVQKLILQEKTTMKKLAKSEMTWTAYHPIESINDWLDSLGEKFPDTVKVISIGNSYENRDMKGVKISFGSERRAVFIEGGIHAREWISPACVTYIINELLTSTDPEFSKIARSFDWYLFPSVNPDGYMFSRTTNRLWRKTRTTYSLCNGADGNRNFDFHWGVYGTSSITCSDTYGGPRENSEVEVENLAKLVKEISPTLDVYLSFHSYSQLLLVPFGNTSEHLGNYNDLKQIGLKSAEALAKKYGTNYIIGNSAELLYKTSGTSMDWAKESLNIPIVYTYELRDTGTYGFLLPSSQIIPNNEEVIDSIIGMFLEAENLGYLKLI